MTTVPEHGAAEQHGPRRDAAGQSAPGQGTPPPSSLTSPSEAQQPPQGSLDRARPRLGGKSIWDWLRFLSNLFIPILIGTIGWGLWQAHQQQQSNQQQTLAQQQSNQQQTLEQQRSSQLLLEDQQHASILQAYMNNMQNFLLNYNLSKSKSGDKIRQVAKEQTLTALRSLDAGRNSLLLRFLQETRLIGGRDAVINLSGADLSDDYLNDAHLGGIDLSGAVLSGAHLSGAELSGAYLRDAILTGADLDGAHLSGADLGYADLSGVGLSGTDLSGAYLRDAILTGADLDGAHLSGANLTSASMDGADLTSAFLGRATLTGSLLVGAHLNSAELGDAHLNGADLSGADLSGADLSGADLSDIPIANLTQPQLDEVRACTNAILLTGLTCHHSSKITLTYWYTESPAEAPVIPKLIARFEQQYPGIKINAINTSYFHTQAAFAAAALAGKAPDVLRSDVGWVTQSASEGYLLNIDSYLSQSDISDYLKAPLGSSPLGYDKYHGHLYGLPQVTDFLALLYNRAELEKAGISSPPPTMRDFERDAREIVRSKKATYGFETNGASYYALPFLYAFGGGLFDQHNILVNNAGSVTGLNFLLRLQNTDQVMPEVASAGNMVKDFMDGKTAMILDGPFDTSQILTGSSFRNNPGNLGIAGVPTGPAGQVGSPLGGQSYVISAGTAHPFEAYEFISFMGSAASQVTIAKANHTLPTRQSAYQDGASSDPLISAFISIKKTAVPRPAIPQGGHLFDAFDSNVAAVLDGAESPVAALNTVAHAWQQLGVGS